MKKLIFLLFFAGSLFAQTYITVSTKSKGDQWTAAEQNQIIGALKDGTLSIKTESIIAKDGFATELWDVAGGHFETAVDSVEYYSPNQHGGIYGTIYRQYFTVGNIAAGGEITIALGLTPNHVPNVGGYVTLSGGNKMLIGSGSGNTGDNIGMYVYVNGSDLNLNANTGTDWDSGFCWIDYTK